MQSSSGSPDEAPRPRDATLRLSLGAFTCSSIRARFGTDIETAALAAVLHYVRRLESGRPPMPFPRLGRGPEHRGGVERKLELSVDPAVKATLEREARREAVTLDQLALHAVMVYLADLDL